MLTHLPGGVQTEQGEGLFFGLKVTYIIIFRTRKTPHKCDTQCTIVIGGGGGGGGVLH